VLRLKTFIVSLGLSIACFAQTAPVQNPGVAFDEQHRRGVEQNPPGVKLTIATASGRSAFHFSEMIRFTLTFASERRHFYTIERSAGSAAGVASDLVILGPDLMAPVHSRPDYGTAIACCHSERRYVGTSPVTIPEVDISLDELDRNAMPLNVVSLQRMKLKPGDYAIFAQTRNIMRGWPKSEQDLTHKLSNIIVTSSNILHITVSPDSR
jgi:hypothetical protein